MTLSSGTACTYAARSVDVADAASAIEVFQRRSYAWTTPTSVNGFVGADAWTPPTPTVADWGRLAVVFNDRDVTFFRGVPAQIGQWGSREPFGYTTFVVEFPQITVFDDFGVGDVDWLAARDDPRWSSVELYRVSAAGSIVGGALWEGEATSYDDIAGGGLRVTCIGCLYVADSLARPPQHRTQKVEHAFLIVENLRRQGGRRNLRTLEPAVEGDPSEFTTRHSGDGGSLLNSFIQRLLAEMIEDDGDQWTVAVDAPRQPVLRQKDFDTVDWTVTCGAPGVVIRCSVDKSQAANVIYGSGSDEAGTEWRGSYRLSSDVTVYRPLAEASDVGYYDRDTYGTTFQLNASFDSRAVRVERWFSFGAGINQADAVDFAGKMLARDKDPSYTGSITLTADPEEGHRFDITAGQNILAQAYRGADVLFHVIEVTHDPRAMATTLTVDSGARDANVIEALLERRRNVMESPSLQLRPQLGSSKFEDRKQPWDERYGFIPIASYAEADVDPRRGVGTYATPTEQPSYYVDVPAGEWVIEQILLPDLAQVERMELAAYDAAGAYKPTAFVCGLFAASINEDDLPANPFSLGAWDFADPNQPPTWYQRAMIMWGQFGQRAGYFPNLESAGASPTGVHRDEGAWTVVLPGTTVAYLVIYSDVAASFRGRIWPSVN